MTSNEVKLHSALIVEMLDPKGSHGMKDLFLKSFIEALGLLDFNLNTKSASVEKEKNIGRKTQTTGGILDIMITDAHKVIIIENKIYEAVGEEFNINSPKQVGDMLFGKLNLKAKGIRFKSYK